QKRPPDGNQARLRFPRLRAGEKDAPGEAKVAVEPGEGERAAVDLHAELEVALVRHVRAGLDPQVGRVGMRPQHAETRLRRGLFSSAEGQQRSAPAKEIAAAGLDAPPLALGELRKSGLP